MQVEISISSFFSLYFGFLFIVAGRPACVQLDVQVGGIIIWRIFSQDAYHKEFAASVSPSVGPFLRPLGPLASDRCSSSLAF